MSKNWWKILQMREVKDSASSNCKSLQLPSDDTIAGTTEKTDTRNKNIATGETSPVITPYHFFGNFNFLNFHH